MGSLLILASLQAAGSWTGAPVPEELAAVETRAVAVAPDGALWFAVRGRGLARFDGSAVRWLAPGSGRLPEDVADVHVDGSGRIWAAGLGGYSLRSGGIWTLARELGELRPRVIFSVGEDPRTGAIWLAGTGGAGRLNGHTWQVFGEADGLPHAVVHAAHTDSSGTHWFACRTGLARSTKQGLEVLYPTTNFRSILEGPAGRLWFGTSDGVFGWDGATWTRALRGRTVYPRTVARDGAIWAGSAETGLYRYDDGRWRRIHAPAAYADAEVFDVAQARDGSIWAASSHGVFRVRQTR